MEERKEWYCLQAKTKREHIAAANLVARCAVPVYAPHFYIERATRTGLRKKFWEAIFPGYLFAHFCKMHDLRHVLSTPGITGIVRFGELIPDIPSDTIAQLQAALPDDKLRDESAPAYTQGDIVQIIAGTFQGSVATVDTLEPDMQRITLLIDFLGRQVKVRLNATQVMKRTHDQRLQAIPDALRRTSTA